MSRKKLLLTLVCTGTVGFLPMFANAAKAAGFTLDFDDYTHSNGFVSVTNDLGISVGDWENKEWTRVSDQWSADFGVTINAYGKPNYDKNTGHYDPSDLDLVTPGAVLFNTDPNYYPTGTAARKNNGDFKGAFDEDLLTGEGYLTVDNNPLSLGNVLIIQERQNRTQTDDEAHGGVISFGFDDLVDLTSIDLLDVSDDFGKRGKQIIFTAYGENDTKLDTWMFDEAALDPDTGTAEKISDQTGDNSLYRFNFEKSGVRRLEVLYPGSGAIAALRWEKNQPPAAIPEPASAVGLMAIAGLGSYFKRVRG